MSNKIVNRLIYSQIYSHINKEEITLIIGPRQVGKTTLVLQLKEDLLNQTNISTTNVYYFNLDVLSDRVIFRSQSDFIQFIRSHKPREGKVYFFIDEVQRIENPGIFFKGIYDLRLPVKLILTGSSSLEIRAKIVEPLTGRKRLFTLLPLSFNEYINFMDSSLVPFLNKIDVYTKDKLMNYFSDFVLYGGYPRLTLERNHNEKVLILEEIFTSYLEKDIVGFFQMKDSYLFTQLVRILAEQIGEMLNVRKLSKELGVAYRTLNRYLSILESTYILKRLLPYFFSTRTAIRKMPKIFFFDTGIRNYAKELREMSSRSLFSRYDTGKLMENFVYSELVKSIGQQVNFWRTKDQAEVDFIIEKKGKIIPIEVKAERQKQPDTSRSFHSFIKRFNPEVGIWINLGFQGTRKVGNTEIHFILPYQLIKVIENL